MPLDGIFLHHLTNELQCLVGARADKIHQPSRDELVFLMRSAAGTRRLLISSRSGSARLQVTEASFDNPAEPPAFCKLLRRHLSSAKLMEISQQGLDRVVFLRFLTYNEMGDTIYPYLVVELITGRANVILCSQEGRILDALHRSDIETSARLIQPGAKYTLPENNPKADPFTLNTGELAAAMVASGRPADGALQKVAEGVSPLVSREVISLCGLDPDTPLRDEDIPALEKGLGVFTSALKMPCPCLLAQGRGFKDFSYMPITQYGEDFTNHKTEGFSALLEGFYSARDNSARINALAQDVLRRIKAAMSRAQRRLASRLSELESCKNREQYRIYGELLKAHLYAIEKGADRAVVQNYYDPDMGNITIPLDPALSPAANAARYFKEYKKTYTAEQTLTALTEKDRKEIIYLDSVLDALSRAENAAELSDIKEELAEAGYIAAPQGKRRKTAATGPKEYTSPSGLRILVGKNNKENDLLTLKTAAKTDLWFHTKNIPGSHVILFTEGKEPDKESIMMAAALAAAHSKAADSDNVPVDLTEVKYVKKPGGAKPGMVIYTSNETVYVTPYKK